MTSLPDACCRFHKFLARRERREGNKRVHGNGSSGSQHELHSVARGTRRGRRDENGGTEGLSTPQLPPAHPRGRLAPCAMLSGLPCHARLAQGLRRAYEGLSRPPAALRPSWSFHGKAPQVEMVAAPLSPLGSTSNRQGLPKCTRSTHG